MATKKKSSKQSKAKKVSSKKPAAKRTAAKATAKAKPKPKPAPLAKTVQRKAPPKLVAKPKKAVSRKNSAGKAAGAPKERGRGRNDIVSSVAFVPEELESRSGGQSGSLQGLSDVAIANSESVDELLEEGNAYEAEVTEGVEDAPDADQGEVHTHEVPEDDVPDEYKDDQ